MIKINFASCDILSLGTVAEDKTMPVEIVINGTNFDDILERRDLEITTKSSPHMSIEDLDELKQDNN